MFLASYVVANDWPIAIPPQPLSQIFLMERATVLKHVLEPIVESVEGEALRTPKCRGADPHYSIANPDPAFDFYPDTDSALHFNPDPDPAFHSCADPDQLFTLMRIRNSNPAGMDPAFLSM
jgi:hypothetical protein